MPYQRTAPVFSRPFPRGAVRLSLLGAVLLLASACSPALNWRSVRLPDAALSLMLPCKPEQASRPVDWGQGPVELSLTGCEADGATFAVSHLRLEDPSQAGAVLAQWRQAVLGRLQVPQAAVDTPFTPAGALALPQSLRSRIEGRSPKGEPVYLQGLWFARLEGSHARLFHVVMLSPRERTAVAVAFFEGVTLP